MFGRPTDADRERRRVDLINRARLVRAHRWDDYWAVWSTGEVVGVAALLGDHDVLAEFDESLQTAWARWAFDLWGLADSGGVMGVVMVLQSGCAAAGLSR